jgi:serine/threonine-protein kinase
VGDPFDYRPGEVVAGRYRVERPIGVGGSAAVYRARRLADDFEVALKVMHDTDASGVGRRRFEREAALVQRLRHPHVVEIFDFGHTEGDLPYIVFALLRGRSLKERIRREGPLEVHKTGIIALQVLDALVVAHDMGIIHRDIKPANLFMCTGEAGEMVKVLDFGLAKALFGDADLLQTLTRTGYRLGTPRYMSPEMARGETTGAPGDLYALALVIGEMLAGTPLIGGQSQAAVLMTHASQAPIAVPDVVGKSPFAQVIARGLAKSLKVRYRSALQMRADLESAMASLGGGQSEDDLDATLHYERMAAAPAIAAAMAPRTASPERQPAAPAPAGGTVPLPPELAATMPADAATGAPVRVVARTALAETAPGQAPLVLGERGASTGRGSSPPTHPIAASPSPVPPAPGQRGWSPPAPAPRAAAGGAVRHAAAPPKRVHGLWWWLGIVLLTLVALLAGALAGYALG